MPFFPLLRNVDDRVFLIHATIEDQQLHAGLLVVDGYVEDGWIAVSEKPGLTSPAYEVQLPQEVLQQTERYKGYAVVCPIRQPA